MTDAVPPWAYAKPEVRAHDPRLIESASTERGRLILLLTPWLVDGVEHVGSTAVPGLAAKPIIDLMASVGDLDAVVLQAGQPLAADGWCYVPPELDSGGSWRRFFVKPDQSGQHRYAHLHLIQVGHPRWAEQITFRDALRRDDELAGRYADLKRRLATEHSEDREVRCAGQLVLPSSRLSPLASRRDSRSNGRRIAPGARASAAPSPPPSTRKRMVSKAASFF